MKTALVQLNCGDDPGANLLVTKGYVAEAAAAGAGFILTPEMTNCISTSQTRQRQVLRLEFDDPTLAALRRQADDLGIWLLIGSLGLKTDDADGRFANRSFLIGPDGGIRARYDKIHMYDVQVTQRETHRESAGYRPGKCAVLAETPFGTIGMSICYDMRFAHLYQALAQAGARILTAPSAFTPVTGAAHWQSLLRARAIENGAYMLAPAQCGSHTLARGKPRNTYGHSLAVSPWGEVLVDGGIDPGVHIFDMDDKEVTRARQKVPSLTHIRPFDGPKLADPE